MPEGRQELAAVIAEMRQIALVAGQCSVEGLDGVTALMAAAEAERLTTWADRLALLLVEAQRPQVQENKDVARVEAMGNSKDNPTAALNETKDATVTPNRASHEPQAEGPPWWCGTCQSWRHTQPCGRVECPAPDQQRNEWLLDDEGGLDDVVVDEPATFRLERMSPDHIWGAVYHRDGSRTTFDVFGDRLSLTYEHEPESDVCGRNQPPSGFRGDPGAPRTVNAPARDEDSAQHGDVPENTTDNPQSWIAWKRRALAAEAKLARALQEEP